MSPINSAGGITSNLGRGPTPRRGGAPESTLGAPPPRTGSCTAPLPTPAALSHGSRRPNSHLGPYVGGRGREPGHTWGYGSPRQVLEVPPVSRWAGGESGRVAGCRGVSEGGCVAGCRGRVAGCRGSTRGVSRSVGRVSRSAWEMPGASQRVCRGVCLGVPGACRGVPEACRGSCRGVCREACRGACRGVPGVCRRRVGACSGVSWSSVHRGCPLSRVERRGSGA